VKKYKEMLLDLLVVLTFNGLLMFILLDFSGCAVTNQLTRAQASKCVKQFKSEQLRPDTRCVKVQRK